MKRLLLIAFCLFVFFVTQASSNNTSSTTAMGVGQNEWVCIGKVTACIKTEPHPYGTVSIAIRQYDVKESDKDFILWVMVINEKTFYRVQDTKLEVYYSVAFGSFPHFCYGCGQYHEFNATFTDKSGNQYYIFI